MGDPLSEVSVEVVVFVLCGLLAINLVLLTALALTIHQDRPAPAGLARASRPVGLAGKSGPGPQTGSESGSV
jgi:hypothetical protein